MKRTALTLLATLSCVSSAAATDFVLLDAGVPAKALIPSAANGGNAAGYVWQQETDPANIDSWTSGTTGVGYDADTANGGNYLPQIGLNVSTMQGASGNGSVFIRIPFTVNAAQRPLFKTMALRMRYDDGFVAWINGTKVASAAEPANLAWNSFTLSGASNAANLTGWIDYPITPHLGLLHDGTNMLAIQGLNANLTSSDLLIVPQLVATDVVSPPAPRWPAPAFTAVPGATGLTRPVAIRNAGDGSGKLYILQQRGVISVLTGASIATFMDINVRVLSVADTGLGGNEEGLLGLAFPPGFAQSRRYYVTYDNTAGNLVLARFRTMAANPAAGDPNSEQILLTINHPGQSNHNGSDIHFGKDGYLYWSTGDGGGGGDTDNSAQDPLSLLGKMLRLDVEGEAGGGSLIPESNPFASTSDGVMDQIYHLGLRNPWRWSFDRLTGDMWIGDVGQDVSYEEVDFVAGNLPARNFEWRKREGLHDYNAGTPYGPGTITPPITERSGADVSVTGGYVYRGRGYPRMNGIYFYGDYGSGNFYGVQQDSAGAWRTTTFTPTVPSVSTFGEDEAGELYWANLNSGAISRIIDSASDAMYLSIVSQSVSSGGRLTFTWGAANGLLYVPEVSTDMVNWAPAGPSQTAGATMRLTFSEASDPPAGTGRRFFRAREL